MTIEAPVTVERVPWDAAMARMDWRQGEHVTLIAPTQSGKTELISRLIEPRQWLIFLGSKRIDRTQDRLVAALRMRRTKDAAEINPQISRRWYARPDWPRHLSSRERQSVHGEFFREVLSTSFRQTGWTTVADEGRYLCQRLGLADECLDFWIQGSSQRSALVFATQRSRHVPLEAYDQCSHLFLWRDNDVANIARVAEMAGLNRRAVLAILPTLGRHDVLYVQPFTGDMFVTNTRWGG